MKSNLYRDFAGDLQKAYEQKAVAVRKTGTCTFVEYIFFNQTYGRYNVHGYGMNRNGVYFTCHLFEKNGEKYFWFQYPNMYEEIIAKFCKENINKSDVLRDLLYLKADKFTDLIEHIEKLQKAA